MPEFDWLAERLEAEDDPDFWRSALTYVLSESEPRPGASVEVGRCSHWLRPHQTRWKADGGFAWPTGYGIDGGGSYSRYGLPQFDWSIVLDWSEGGWEPAPRRSVRHLLRLALPSRTRRHGQAAIHALWHAGREKRVVFYGFRRRGGAWVCTAS